MALAVPSFNKTLYTRCSPPQPLAKSARLWGVHWHRTGWRLAGCTLGARQRRGFSPQLLRATWSRPNVFISTMPTCDSRRWALLPGCDTKHNEWIARVLFELGSLIQVINSTGETSQKCELKTWQGLILNENK